MFALTNQPSPAGKGDRRSPVDEETEVCTADTTRVYVFYKITNFRLGENLPFKKANSYLKRVFRKEFLI